LAVDTIDGDVQNGQCCGEPATALAPDGVRSSLKSGFVIRSPKVIALRGLVTGMAAGLRKQERRVHYTSLAIT
jgi:hypothetical protein